MRTQYSWQDRILHFIENIEIGLGFKEISIVTLKIERSNDWRTWSEKNIGSQIYVGNWRIDVVPTDSEKIICSVYFKVI